MIAWLKKRKGSAFLARDRMQMLLCSERIQSSPQTMRILKQDLIHTVNKYTGTEDAEAILKVQKDPAILFFQIPLKKGGKPV